MEQPLYIVFSKTQLVFCFSWEQVTTVIQKWVKEEKEELNIHQLHTTPLEIPK